MQIDHLFGIVVSTSDYHPRGPGFDSRLYPRNLSGSTVYGLERGPPSLVRPIGQLLDDKQQKPLKKAERSLLSECSAQGQVFHCKLSHQGCSSAQRQVFHCKLWNQGCSNTTDDCNARGPGFDSRLYLRNLSGSIGSGTGSTQPREVKWVAI